MILMRFKNHNKISADKVFKKIKSDQNNILQSQYKQLL